MSARLMLLMLILPLAAEAADEGRVRYLEQEVRDLNRQVAALARRIDDLSRPALPAPGNPVRAPAEQVPPSAQWLDAARWRQVRPGLGELDVIRLLGAPTSMRETAEGRVLFYALEIGTSGFLGGSVTLRDHAVTEVRIPVLQ